MLQRLLVCECVIMIMIIIMIILIMNMLLFELGKWWIVRQGDSLCVSIFIQSPFAHTLSLSLSFSQEDSPQSLVTAAIHGLVDIFKHYIVKHSEWFTNNTHTSSIAKSSSLPLSDTSIASNLYPLWLRSKYQLSLTTFLDYINISPYQVSTGMQSDNLIVCVCASISSISFQTNIHNYIITFSDTY